MIRSRNIVTSAFLADSFVSFDEEGCHVEEAQMAKYGRVALA